jgi:hypothetical protein
MEPSTLLRYLDEQAFRFNNRKMTDRERFSAALSGIVGKTSAFDQLAGKPTLEMFLSQTFQGKGKMLRMIV